MLLAAVLSVFAIGWAFWFVYMVRYSKQWAARVERHRRLLLGVRLDLAWMHRLEKGPGLKVLVGFVLMITLMCIVILLHHPTALQDFWSDLHRASIG